MCAKKHRKDPPSPAVISSSGSNLLIYLGPALHARHPHHHYALSPALISSRGVESPRRIFPTTALWSPKSKSYQKKATAALFWSPISTVVDYSFRRRRSDAPAFPRLPASA